MSASTVFDDLVAATIKRLNIYSYPVIGHCIKDSSADDAALADNSACPAGERPLILQFSGPDQIIHLQPTEGRVWSGISRPSSLVKCFPIRAA